MSPVAEALGHLQLGNLAEWLQALATLVAAAMALMSFMLGVASLVTGITTVLIAIYALRTVSKVIVGPTRVEVERAERLDYPVLLSQPAVPQDTARPKEVSAAFIRLRVRNRGEYLAKQATGKVLAISRLEGTKAVQLSPFEEQVLGWSGGGNSTDILVGDSRLLNVAYKLQGPTVPGTSGVAEPGSPSTLTIMATEGQLLPMQDRPNAVLNYSPGVYFATIQVAGANFGRVEVTLKLASGSQHTDLEADLSPAVPAWNRSLG